MGHKNNKILFLYSIAILFFLIDYSQTQHELEEPVVSDEFVSLKYLSEKEKQELKKELEENIHISAGQCINEFTSFYDQLTSNGKLIRDAILKASKKPVPELSVTIIYDDSKNKFNKTDLANELNKDSIAAFSSLLLEYPELWWINSFEYYYYYYSNYLHKVKYFIIFKDTVLDNFTVQDIIRINKKIEMAKNDIVQKIKELNLTTDYAILRYIHDYLIVKSTYLLDENRTHIRNLYGCMVESKCVCEGYAEAFQYLAHQFNIDCISVRSSSHEWNFVKLHGKWYHVDVTWDDPGSSLPGFGYDVARRTSYFMAGTTYIENNDTSDQHKLIYTIYTNYEYDLLDFPVTSSENYVPTSEEEAEVERMENVFPDSYLSVASLLPNCGINLNYNVVCPSELDYFCIGDNNSLYRSDGNLGCTEVYNDSINKDIFFVKDDNGYKEVTSLTSTYSKYTIYECLNIYNVQSGCTTKSDECYFDSTNKNVYIFQPDDNLFTQLNSGKCYDSVKCRYYICQLDKSCYEVENGYYLTGTEIATNVYDQLIYCYSSECIPITHPMVDGYYISEEGEQSSLIKCTNTSTEQASCSIALTSQKLKTIGYGYLDAGHVNSTSTEYAGVITCSNSSLLCSSISKPDTSSKKLYFIDGDSVNDDHIIHCDHIECQSEAVTTDDDGFAYMYGTTENYILVVNGSKLNVIASAANINSNEYYIDGTETNKIISCSYDEELNEVKCLSKTSNSEDHYKTYYIDSSRSGNIIECTNKCQSKSANPGYYINGNDSEKFPLIQCQKNDENIDCKELSTTDMIDGYYVDASSFSENEGSYSNMFYCDKSKVKLFIYDGYEYRYVTTIQKGYYLDGSSSSNNTDYGKIIYCKDSNSCTQVTTTVEGFYLDASATSDNKEYSQLIQCNGSKYFTFLSLKKGFYLSGDSSNDGGQKYQNLIKCSSSTSTSCSLYSSKIKGYYLDGTSTNNEVDYSTLIYYDGKNYISEFSFHNGYYMDASSSINNIDYSSVIICNNSTSTCSTSTNNMNGFYIDGSSFSSDHYTKLIKYSDSNYSFVKKINNGYYLEGSSTSDGERYSKVIYCDDSKLCSIITAMKNGYYFDGSAVIDSKSYSNLIVCNGTDYKYISSLQIGYYLDGGSTSDNINYNKIIYCSSNSNCTLITSSITGFYIDASSTVDNLKYSRFIKYNGENYVTYYINNIGYYLDGSSSTDNINYNTIIYCDSVTTCSVIAKDSINNGYYIEGTDEKSKKLIKCLDLRCKLITSEGSETENAYYISGENNEYLIECDKDQCIYKKNDSVAIYLTNGEDKNEKIILCDTSCSYVLSEDTKCEVSEDLGNIIYEEKKLKLCMETSEDSIVWKEITIENGIHFYLLPKNIAEILLTNLNISENNILMKSSFISKSVLFYQKPTYGYYINNDDSIYIECDKSGCKDIVFYDSCEENENIGKLVKLKDEIFICTTTNYSGNKLQINDGNDNKYYFIEKGFPGAIDCKAVISIDEFSATVKTGSYANEIKDDNGNKKISTTITKCSLNDDLDYTCVDEETSIYDYYYDESTSNLYLVTDIESYSVEEIFPEYYINKDEVIIIDPKSDSTTTIIKIKPISILNEFRQ
eukprot:jgi/Orpsp1_1/1190109/evm.model.d7180000076634.1